MVRLHQVLAHDREQSWQAVAELATAQYGVASGWQLVRLGISRHAIRHRVATGQLHRVHRNVYAVGHPGLSRRGRQAAGILACGPGALSCGLSAADIHVVRADPRALVDVATLTGIERRHSAVVTHRLGRLTEADLTVRSKVPVTSLPRTLLDLAAARGAVEVREAISRAQRDRTLDVPAIEELLDRSAGCRGVAILREATEELRGSGGVTRRELERRFLALCRRQALPEPIVNGLIRLEHQNLQVDFHWPAARLVVETDGYASHSDIASHEEDRHRDQELRLLGWEVVRFTWKQVRHQPARTGRIVGEIHAARTARRRPGH